MFCSLGRFLTSSRLAKDIRKTKAALQASWRNCQLQWTSQNWLICNLGCLQLLSTKHVQSKIYNTLRNLCVVNNGLDSRNSTHPLSACLCCLTAACAKAIAMVIWSRAFLSDLAEAWREHHYKVKHKSKVIKEDTCFQPALKRQEGWTFCTLLTWKM